MLVERVSRGSRATGNGLQEGDVIVAANSGRFDDLSGFRLGFTDHRGGLPSTLVLRIVRGNMQGDLPMQ